MKWRMHHAKQEGKGECHTKEKKKKKKKKKKKEKEKRNSHGIILVQQVAETHPRITLWCLNLQWLRANFFRRHDPRLR